MRICRNKTPGFQNDVADYPFSLSLLFFPFPLFTFPFPLFPLPFPLLPFPLFPLLALPFPLFPLFPFPLLPLPGVSSDGAGSGSGSGTGLGAGFGPGAGFGTGFGAGAAFGPGAGAGSGRGIWVGGGAGTGDGAGAGAGAEVGRTDGAAAACAGPGGGTAGGATAGGGAGEGSPARITVSFRCGAAGSGGGGAADAWSASRAVCVLALPAGPCALSPCIVAAASSEFIATSALATVNTGWEYGEPLETAASSGASVKPVLGPSIGADPTDEPFPGEAWSVGLSNVAIAVPARNATATAATVTHAVRCDAGAARCRGPRRTGVRGIGVG